MRISGIIGESITDGKGVRTTVFFQGCPHKCDGCHNPETWDYGGGYDIEPEEVIEKVLENPIIKGVTFSGGEPFSVRNYKDILKVIKGVEKEGRDIWIYTGYTLEELEGYKIKDIDEILSKTTYLVDGQFIKEKKNLELRFKGSSNQRVIDMVVYRASGVIVELE